MGGCFFFPFKKKVGNDETHLYDTARHGRTALFHFVHHHHHHVNRHADEKTTDRLLTRAEKDKQRFETNTS